MKNLIIIGLCALSIFACKSNKEQVNIDKELETLEKNAGTFDPASFEKNRHLGLVYQVVDGKIDPNQTPTLSIHSGNLPFKNGSDGQASVSIQDNSFKEVFRYGLENPLNMRNCIPEEGQTGLRPIKSGSITLLVPDMVDIGQIVLSVDGEKVFESKVSMRELLAGYKEQEQPKDTVPGDKDGDKQ